MAGPAIVHANIDAKLNSAPINPRWILKGTPTARNAVLSTSNDGTACTLVWDCTEGEFEWHYDVDETIHILEGSVLLSDGQGAPRRIGPGDVVFFPAGSKARWSVEGYVRKLAFFRRALPKPIALVTRAMRKAKRLVRNSRPPGTAWTGAPKEASAQPRSPATGMSAPGGARR